MEKNLAVVKLELDKFLRFEITHILSENNSNDDFLARLAPSRDVDLMNLILIEILFEPSIEATSKVMEVDPVPSWMDLRSEPMPEASS